MKHRHTCSVAALLAVSTVGCGAGEATAGAGAESDDPDVAIAYQFLQDYNDGNVEKVLGRLLETVDYVNEVEPGDWPYDVSGYEDVAEFVAWTVAAGTKLIEPTCARDRDRLTRTIDCSFLWDNPLRRALGEVPLPGGIVMTLNEDDKIIEFAALTVPRAGRSFNDFAEWLKREHPEDFETAVRVTWDSIEQAVETGELRRSHHDEWAASLPS